MECFPFLTGFPPGGRVSQETGRADMTKWGLGADIGSGDMARHVSSPCVRTEAPGESRSWRRRGAVLKSGIWRTSFEYVAVIARTEELSL